MTRVIPLAFVLLWSTGFIGATYALPFIEPFNLLFIRMLLTLAVFSLLIALFKARWPTRRQAVHQLVVGTLVHAAYLGGVFAAIKLAMPAGVVALLVGLQPLLTALLAWQIDNARLRAVQWIGFVLGLLGVTLVLWRGESLRGVELGVAPLLAIAVALFGISLGTLYQKRFGTGTNLLTGSFYQYLATALWMGFLTLGLEQGTVHWTPQLVAALLWLVFGLSTGAILLLMWMIREGEAARVAAYFYLVPPATAFESWLLFDEQLGMVSLVGIAVAVVGVYLVLQQSRRERPALE